jgi:hypothetical protein
MREIIRKYTRGGYGGKIHWTERIAQAATCGKWGIVTTAAKYTFAATMIIESGNSIYCSYSCGQQ